MGKAIIEASDVRRVDWQDDPSGPHARDRFRQPPDYGPSTLSDLASQIEACFSRQRFRSRALMERRESRAAASTHRFAAMSFVLDCSDLRLFWPAFSRTSFMMRTSLWRGDRCRESATPAPLAWWYLSWYGFGAQAESAIITMRSQIH